MIPLTTLAGKHTRSIPRESGDDPAPWSGRDAETWVFPARAGMIQPERKAT